MKSEHRELRRGERESSGARAGVPTLIGIPLDVNSSYLRGPAEAPSKIREALRSDAANSWTELGVDLGAAGAYNDAGDLALKNFADSVTADFSEIEQAIGKLLDEGRRPVSLGGDHSITYPVIKAFARRYPDLTIVHFDAHADLYDEFQGSRVSHACPFARIMENRLARRLVQVGIRTLTGHQREQAEKFGVEIVSMAAIHSRASAAYESVKIQGPVYISFDMDVLDPAFAPGISHREPGGMTVREAIAHLHAVEERIVGADLVEFNPRQDVAGLTGIVAGKILKKILKEILGMMVGQG